MMRGRLLSTLIVMATGLLFVSGNVIAPHHVNSARITTSRSSSQSGNRQKIRIGHTIYTFGTAKPSHEHLSNYQIRLDLRQLKAQTLHDVRMERANDMSTSITSDQRLNRLASIRARQVARHFSHYSRGHRPMTLLDAHRAGLPHGFQASENIASAGLGNCTVVGDPKMYHNHNGRDMANMSNDGMMHYDIMESNGHRKNILSSDNTLIGVGASYSHRKHEFYLVEDFGDRNPQSSADVSKKDFKAHLKPARHSTARRLWTVTWNWIQRAYRHIRHRF